MSIEAYTPYLDWIDGQYERMVRILEQWSNTNSGSENLEGLAEMRRLLISEFTCLDGVFSEHDLPPRSVINEHGHLITIPGGQVLSLVKRPDVASRILLAGHFDTVYSKENPFQTTSRISLDILQGPGVADMKGGLVVMLIALEALERSPWASRIGWEVLFNPDEEIGSPGSAHLFHACAKRACLGLIFEPAMEGKLVSERKGSMNFTVVVRGKSAHAGRHFHLGRSAIYALSHFICLLEDCNDLSRGITVNVGNIRGGEAVNVVPDLAICRFNIRVTHTEDFLAMKQKVDRLIHTCRKREGITFELYEDSKRGPKPFEGPVVALYEKIKKCGEELGMPIQWCPSGGVSDGNLLASVGLPTADTLGVEGGDIHSSSEYVKLSSLVEKAKLAALFLMKGDYL